MITAVGIKWKATIYYLSLVAGCATFSIWSIYIFYIIVEECWLTDLCRIVLNQPKLYMMQQPLRCKSAVWPNHSICFFRNPKMDLLVCFRLLHLKCSDRENFLYAGHQWGESHSVLLRHGRVCVFCHITVETTILLYQCMSCGGRIFQHISSHCLTLLIWINICLYCFYPAHHNNVTITVPSF